MDELAEDAGRKVVPLRLSDASLDALPSAVARPRYDRGSLTPGIVHIGLGNFHRAHQAWYLHRLMEQGAAKDWAIIGAGVRPYDAAMRQKLLAQDCLTTLIELDPSGMSAEVTGPMIDYLPIEEGNGALIKAMAAPNIRIVALTVTEGGYFVDPATGDFDADHPDMVFDAANPNCPRSAFGAIIAALRIRRAAGHAAFTTQSCDNLQGNGDVLRNTVLSLARMSDPDLADWIEAHATFPNSMVDCIVPATGPSEIALAHEIGIDDAAPVTHENFRQWVIEDDFSLGRPDWDRAGATFTDRVHDYEMMKIRMLNAGHQILANVGEILSVPTIADCMADPNIASFFRKVEVEEIAPFVDAVPEMRPLDYVDLISKRFANPAIRDTTRRVAFDGASRHPGFLLPTLKDALAAGTDVSGLSLAEAFWARMCAGQREDGTHIEPNDPYWADLNAAALAAATRPSAWLEQDNYYGGLARETRFAAAFGAWLSFIWEKGSREALKAYVSGKSL